MSQTLANRRSARRRRRTEAREQILAAARQHLKTKRFRDLTVDDLMAATGYGRTAFYRYFPDREAVLIELLEELWEELEQTSDILRVPTESAGASDRDAMSRLRSLLGDNSSLLKAIADAASGDEDVEEAYRALMREYWIRDLVGRVAEAQALGFAADLDPELTGEALAWMAERFVTQSLDRDPQEVLRTIVAIVAKCLYGTTPFTGTPSRVAASERPDVTTR
jgi:TetR/AcrR family transcriptional regulator, ethionamide resistance regulator